MVAIGIVVLLVAVGAGFVFPRWWLVVPAIPLMVLGYFGVGVFFYLPLAVGLGVLSGRAVRRGRPVFAPPRGATLIAVLLYVAVMTAYVYGVENTARVNSGFWSGWIVTAFLAAVYVGVGAAVGEWWAAFLPILVVLIALPAGTNSAYEGDIDAVAFSFVFL